MLTRSTTCAVTTHQEGKWLNRAIPDTSHNIRFATCSVNGSHSRLPGLRVRAVQSTGVYDDEADHSIAPAHARRHEDPQHVAEHAIHLRACGGKLQRLPPTIAGQARH